MNQDIQGSNAGITALIYGLQGLSLLVGVPLFVGVVINYVKREDVRGS